MRDLIETISHLVMSQKMTATAISVSVTTLFADAWLWFDSNLVKLSAAASFILLILMIIGRYCEIVRSNRAAKIDQIEQELRIEKLRRETQEMKND